MAKRARFVSSYNVTTTNAEFKAQWTVVEPIKPLVLSPNGRILTAAFDDIINPSLVATNVLNVRVASTSNVSIASPGATIDGVTLAVGNRILLKAQTVGSQNGVYINGGLLGLTRALGFDESTPTVTGLLVTVAEGTVNAGTVWMLTTFQPITLDTTALEFLILGDASANIVTVNFGTVPVYTKQFTVSFAGLTPGMHVRCETTGYTPVGVYFDEYEFGSLAWVGKCVIAGQLLLLGTSSSPINGERFVRVT